MEYSVDFKNIKGEFNIVFEIDNKVNYIPTPLDKQGMELLLEEIENIISEEEVEKLNNIDITKIDDEIITLTLSFKDGDVQCELYFNDFMDDSSPDDCSINYTYKKLKYDNQ